jgi:hypothetical protein
MKANHAFISIFHKLVSQRICEELMSRYIQASIAYTFYNFRQCATATQMISKQSLKFVLHMTFKGYKQKERHFPNLFS